MRSLNFFLFMLFCTLAVQAGARFKVNSNGTVLDNSTGLIWQRCSAGQKNDKNCSGKVMEVTGKSGTPICEDLKLAGRTWRLPTIEELASLLDYGKYKPAIDKRVFPNTPSQFYWSSTPDVKPTKQFWSAEFEFGIIRQNHYIQGFAVRCVTDSQEK